MKCYVLIISKHFPVNHPKAGKETDFENKIKKQIKKHTIRANYDFWKKRVDEINAGKAYLSVRQWKGQPYRSKQIEICRYYKLGIEKLSMEMHSDYTVWQINDSKTAYHLWDVATNDGLSYEDFQNWFGTDYYTGAIIHFTDFRYLNKTL